MRRALAVLLGTLLGTGLLAPARAVPVWPADAVFTSHACEEVWYSSAESMFICLDTLHYRHVGGGTTLATQVEIGCKHRGAIVQCHGVRSVNREWVSGKGYQPTHTMLCGTKGGPYCQGDGLRNYDSSGIPRVAVGRGTWSWKSLAYSVQVDLGWVRYLTPGDFEGPATRITIS